MGKDGAVKPNIKKPACLQPDLVLNADLKMVIEKLHKNTSTQVGDIKYSRNENQQ